MSRRALPAKPHRPNDLETVSPPPIVALHVSVQCEEARGCFTPQLAVGANFRAGHILALFYAVQRDHVLVLRAFANGEYVFGYCQRCLFKYIPA
jgi:hypothetical protein